MAEEKFLFKAASTGGEDNRIVVDCQNPKPPEDFIESNEREAKRLAGWLACWLTPASTRALAAELKHMDY
jgi:hypothetical protein